MAIRPATMNVIGRPLCARDVGDLEPFADARHKNERQGEADADADLHDRHEQAHVRIYKPRFYIEYGNAEHRAVGGDKREKYPERI